MGKREDKGENPAKSGKGSEPKGDIWEWHDLDSMEDGSQVSKGYFWNSSLDIIRAAGVITTGVNASVPPYSITTSVQEVHFQELVFIVGF